MENNVKSEFDLYPAMCKWLKVHLEDKYKNKKSEVVVVDCHSVYLDLILEKWSVIKYYPSGGKLILVQCLNCYHEGQSKYIFYRSKKNCH